MNVFNIRSVDDSLRLGQLKGNHFDIVIRNLKNQINDSANLRERILEAVENVKVRKLHFLKKLIYFWLSRVLVAVRGIFHCGMWASLY